MRLDARAIAAAIFAAFIGEPAHACEDDYGVWPEHGRLPRNGRFLVEGRGALAAIVAKLEDHHPVLVAEAHRVHAVVVSSEVGDHNFAQAWLEPARELQVGQTYVLWIDKKIAVASRMPIAFAIDEWPDDGAPVFFDTPELVASEEAKALSAANDLLLATVHDDGPVLLQIDAVRPRTKEESFTRFFQRIGPDGVVRLRYDACASPFVLRRGEPAILTFTAIDTAGHRADAPGRGIVMNGLGLLDGHDPTSAAFATARTIAPMRLTVLVRDNSGHPVDNALVSGFWARRPQRTNRQGVVTFRNVTNSTVKFRVQHGEHGIVELSETLPDRIEHTIVAKFAPGRRLDVFVHDETGMQTPDVTVSLRGDKPSASPRQAVTGSAGEVSFRGLALATYTLVVDDRPDHAVFVSTIEAQSPLNLESVVLRRPNSVSGRVIVPPGNVGTGWKIRADLVDAPDELQASTSTSTKAGEDGSYRLGGLSRGRYRIVATPKDPSSTDGEPTARHVDVTGDLVGIDLYVGGLTFVEGRIRYVGRDPPGALTARLIGRGLPDLGGRTDAERGEFFIRVAEPGTFKLILAAPGFRAVEERLEVTDEPNRPQLTMRAAEGIRGRVVGMNGRPIGGARVTARMHDPIFPPSPKITDRYGRFSFDQLEVGDRVTLSILARGRATRQVVVSDKHLVVPMPRGAPMLSRVVVDQQNLRGARFVVRALANPTGDDALVDTTLAVGRIHVGNLPYGVHQIEITPKGSQQTWIRTIRALDAHPSSVTAWGGGVRLALDVPESVAMTGDVRVSILGDGAPSSKVIVGVPVGSTGGTILVSDIGDGDYRAVVSWLGPSQTEVLFERAVRIRAANGPTTVRLTP